MTEELENNEHDYEGDDISAVEEINTTDPETDDLELEECKIQPDEANDEANGEVFEEIEPEKDIHPEPPPTNDSSKSSDDGYISEVCYNVEIVQGETSQSLLNKEADVEVQEDVHAYAVPEIAIDTRRNASKSPTDKKKRKSLRGIFCGSVFEPTKDVPPKDDDMKEKYYNPPADVRGSYFPPENKYPIIRVLLSSVIALAAGFIALFLLLVSLHPLLSFSISFVVFTVVFVIPMTLLHQGFVCVFALIFPSVFSPRVKIAGFCVLVVLTIIGPILGIANKLNIATTCDNGKAAMWNRGGVAMFSTNFVQPSVAMNPQNERQTSSSSVQNKCIRLFQNVSNNCHKTFDRLQVHCNASKVTLSRVDDVICRKGRSEFCEKDLILLACSAHRSQKIHDIETVISIFLYLLPVLILLLFNDAYKYNKVYLTTKYSDNIYITQRLREFDSERRSRGLTDLILPLTRIEFQKYLVRGGLSLSKTEKTEIMKWLCILLSFGFTILCFILIEDSINSALLRSIIISPCKRMYQANTDIRYRNYIYILLGAFLFVTLMQSYMLRLRSVICDRFYPDMVRIRAKHLYYKILHDRHSFARHIRRKVQLLAEAKRLSRRISCLSKIYHVLPRSLKDACRKVSIKKCMICDSITYWTTVECPEENCRAHYCFECYVDSGQECLTCKVPTSPPPQAPTPKSNPLRE